MTGQCRRDLVADRSFAFTQSWMSSGASIRQAKHAPQRSFVCLLQKIPRAASTVSTLSEIRLQNRLAAQCLWPLAGVASRTVQPGIYPYRRLTPGVAIFGSSACLKLFSSACCTSEILKRHRCRHNPARKGACSNATVCNLHKGGLLNIASS